MASIQQSLNALIGAAAGAATMGSYMYRQSGTYQAQKAGLAAEKLSKTAKEYTEGLPKKMTEEQGQTIIGLDQEISSLRKEALMASPNRERAEAYKNALVRQDISETDYSREGLAVGEELERRPHKVVKNDKGEWEVQFLDEAAATPKAEAERAALDRVARTTEAQTTQREALKDRFNFLKAFSAKERRQFETAYNRHKNKGEID